MFFFGQVQEVSAMSKLAEKAQAKADQAATAERKAKEAALGLNSVMKKAIQGDVLLCTVCGATQMGPAICECKGGRTKPAADYPGYAELIAAANARQAAKRQAEKLEVAKHQGSVAATREKQKAARGAVDIDDDAVAIEDDGIACLQVVTFDIGKPGLSLEKNVVCKVLEASQATELGVKAG